MTRVFVRPEQIVGSAIALGADDSAHLAKVMRAKVGDDFAAVDGTGRELIARILRIDRSGIAASVVRIEAPPTEPRVRAIVAQALPKTAEKLEWALQHAVEIGAAGFVLFRSRRSEAGKLAERQARWEKIVISAAEQSGRVRLPTIGFAKGLPGALEALASGCERVLFCDELATSDQSLRAAIAHFTGTTIGLLIGPEGGWAPEERDAAAESGAIPITLGPRILRTETAALSALSKLLYALDGD